VSSTILHLFRGIDLVLMHRLTYFSQPYFAVLFTGNIDYLNWMPGSGWFRTAYKQCASLFYAILAVAF
jgi:hypothetical protein